jgi:chromosomal replication initiator protein
MITTYCNVQPFQVLKYVPSTKSPVATDLILSIVSEVFGISVVEITSKSRQRTITDARAVVSHLLKCNIKNITLKKIGAITGGRDHASAIHSLNAYNDLMQTDKQFNVKVKQAQDMLREATNG